MSIRIAFSIARLPLNGFDEWRSCWFDENQQVAVSSRAADTGRLPIQSSALSSFSPSGPAGGAVASPMPNGREAHFRSSGKETVNTTASKGAIRSKSRSVFRIGRWPPSGKLTLEECCWSRSEELANLHGANLLTKNPNRSGLRPMMIAANTLGTYSRVSAGSARAR